MPSPSPPSAGNLTEVENKRLYEYNYSHCILLFFLCAEHRTPIDVELYAPQVEGEEIDDALEMQQ